MKNYALFTGCLLLASFAYSQIEISPDDAFAECPEQWITYTAINTFEGGCNYFWEVTNGEIQGGIETSGKWTFSGGNIISVKWKNSTSSGTIKVTSSNCIDANGNITRDFTIPILTLQGVTPGTIFGPESIPANNTNNRTYEVPSVNHPNRGTSDPNPLQVNGYDWQIPSGWTIVSGENSNRVTVKPDAFSEGTIRVRGKLLGCANSPYYSNWSPVFPVNRTVQKPGTISGNNGRNYVVCNDTNPITFEVVSVPGATSYTWTKPSGWSGNSTTRTIILTPNGTSAGNITVKANSGPYSSEVSSRSLSLQLTDPQNPPSISGPSLLCYGSESNFTLSNLPAGASISWQTSSNLTIVSGQNTSTLRVEGGAFNGNGWIEPTLTSACGSITLNRKNLHVGERTDVTISGLDNDLVIGQTASFQLANSNGCGQFDSESTSSNIDILYTGPDYGMLTTNSSASPGQTGWIYMGVAGASGIYKEFQIVNTSPPPSPPSSSQISIQRIPNTYPYSPYNSWKMIQATYGGQVNHGDVDYWEWRISSSYAQPTSNDYIVFLPSSSYYTTVEARACNSAGCSGWQYTVIP